MSKKNRVSKVEVPTIPSINTMTITTPATTPTTTSKKRGRKKMNLVGMMIGHRRVIREGANPDEFICSHAASPESQEIVSRKALMQNRYYHRNADLWRHCKNIVASFT